MSGQTLQKKLEQRVDPKYRAFLLTEIPKGEALLKQTPQSHPLYDNVLGPLSKMYLEMNRQLGIVCQAIEYPLQQWKWDESRPMEELAKLYPGIELTQWYQRHLSMMINPPAQEHPWTKILTK